MTEAVVIRCKHVFHRDCLKKWLTIQERCPMCHTLLEEPMPKLKPKIVIPPAAFPIPVNRLDHLRPAVNHPLVGNDHEHAD